MTYQATWDFDFTTTSETPLDLTFLSSSFTGGGFDSLTLDIDVNESSSRYTFLSVGDAESFFATPLALGSLSAGSQSVSFDEYLTASQNGEGFAFDYGFAPTPITLTTPEPSTWGLMLLGFTGVGLAAYRRQCKAVASI